jgi:hypothetical protein
VRLLVVNWQDRENPQAGGAEIHLHEIFGRLAAQGNEVTLLCGGWPDCPPRTMLDGMQIIRVGTRYTFPFRASAFFRRELTGRRFDLMVEDINKVPLYTPRWGGPPVVALVPHLFGSTAFQELSAPLAAAVWLAERPLGRAYRGVPFEATTGVPHAAASRLVIPHPSFGDAKTSAQARRSRRSFSSSLTRPRNRTRSPRSSDAARRSRAGR